MNNCKFYVEDTDAKLEAEACEKACRESMGEEVWETEQDNKLSKCMYCKYFKESKGYPGEYLYGCSFPGNEQILYVDSNESEII